MTPREALEKVRPLLDYCVFTHYNEEEVSAILAEVDAVLAKPERNCDRIETGLDALHAWEDYTEKHPELPPSCKTNGAMVPWLFASVDKEKEIPLAPYVPTECSGTCDECPIVQCVARKKPYAPTNEEEGK